MDLTSRPKPALLPLLQILLLLGLIALLYFPSVSVLFERWTRWDEGLSHSLPTLGIFLFLCWRAQPWAYREDSRGLRILLLGLLCLTSVCWLVFDLIQIGILAYLSLLALLLFAIATSYSFKTACHLLIPLGVLIFTLPLWEYLTGTLVTLSAYAVGWLGDIVDIAILIDGNNIFIPYGRLYIDDGCSGLRYLVIALLMAYLLSCVNHYRPRQIIIAVALAAALALLTNWIRIFALVMIGYHTEMQSSLMHDHEMFGWILFASIMLPAIYFAPVNRPPSIKSIQQPLKFKPVWPIVCLASGPLLALFLTTLEGTQNLLNLDAIQAERVHTISSEQFIRVNVPEGGVRETRVYQLNDTLLSVELAQYSPQTLQQGSNQKSREEPQKKPREKIVPYFGSLHDKTSWVLIEEKPNEAMAQLGAKISLFRRVNDQQQIVLLHRYQVGDNATSSYEKSKFLQLPAALFGKHYFNIFTVQAVCTAPNCEQALAAVTQLAETWVRSQER